MNISFDMDDTLVSSDPRFLHESYTVLPKLLGAERLRQGTVSLFRQLEKRGHQVIIYTTSHRSVYSLRKTFMAYGLRPERFINGEENRKVLQSFDCHASKNPGLFNIDLHIDDLPGVGVEAERYTFDAVIIAVDDTAWVEKILYTVDTYGM